MLQDKSNTALKYGEKPFFSVIIPVYNSERTLHRTLVSLLNQSFEDYEVIIVNDGSTDNSEGIVNDLFRDQMNVLYLSQNNIGVAAARNRAINASTGKYIAFLDADDLWNENKLEFYYNSIKANTSACIFYSDYFLINECDKKIGKEIPPTYLNYQSLLRRNYICLSSAVVKRVAINNIFFENIGHEDYNFWLDVLSQVSPQFAGTKVISDVPLTLYRVSARSVSANKRSAAKWHWLILEKQNVNVVLRLLYFANYAFCGAWRVFRTKLIIGRCS